MTFISLQESGGLATLDPLYSYAPGSYGMNFLAKGWYASFEMRIAMVLRDHTESYSMGIEIIA
jgi:hypothetical protein